MKRVHSIIITIGAIILSGCGSNTDEVKNGILEFNKTITVGQALDNWKSCESKKWEEYSSDNGVKVVQFICSHKIKEYIEKAKSYIPSEINSGAIYLDIDSYVQTFQFTMNKDDTFQIHNVSAEMKWGDGEKSQINQTPLEQLQLVYENKMNFDISELNDISAPQFAFYMKLGKSGEKYKKITDTVESIIPEATQQKTTEQDAITQITEEKQQKSWKPSFNCDKARTFIEKSICSERLLGNMDGAMAENYQYMMASNIGDGARNDLKSTQKQWILERNKCTSIQCIELAYRKRIDEICEYPVISGIHPICTMSDEIK